MEYQPMMRSAGSFQQAVGAEKIQSICRRAFGDNHRVTSAVELSAGMYNNTYRLALTGIDRPMMLRVAPQQQRQFRSEWQLMRNEYASLPWLTPIAPLMPRIIAADWSHQVIDRDWMIQSMLDGVPAPGPLGLSAYPRSTWAGFFRQLGAIAKTVHAIRGPHFGPINGPVHPTWSAAVAASLTDIAGDLDSVGLDAADIRKVEAMAYTHHQVLDEINEPRMMPGDLWTVNVMLAEGTPEPTITGVVDMDRTWWGDPAADWTIRMALAKPGSEREAFWDDNGGYGELDRSPASAWRLHVYQARHIGAIRLECHRLGNTEGVRRTYSDLADVLAQLS